MAGFDVTQFHGKQLQRITFGYTCSKEKNLYSRDSMTIVQAIEIGGRYANLCFGRGRRWLDYGLFFSSSRV
jgi:hypothetical protein